jgi:hypothetical protein
MEEICDTPAEILSSRDPTGACAEEAWKTVGGKGADFWNRLKRLLIKKTVQANSLYMFSRKNFRLLFGFVSSLKVTEVSLQSL